MTAELTKLYSQERSSTTPTAGIPRSSPQYVETTVSGRDETGITIIGEDGTGVFFPDNSTPANVFPLKGYGSSKANFQRATPSVSVEALYPHWEGADQGAGQAVRLVREAAKELQRAIESMCSSEIELSNSLVLAESQLFKALKVAGFNKAFEIALNFCAWALRNGENDIAHLPQLPGMCAALNELERKPFVGVDRATEIVLDLEAQGWSGASPISIAFENALDLNLLDFGD